MLVVETMIQLGVLRVVLGVVVDIFVVAHVMMNLTVEVVDLRSWLVTQIKRFMMS